MSLVTEVRAILDAEDTLSVNYLSESLDKVMANVKFKDSNFGMVFEICCDNNSYTLTASQELYISETDTKTFSNDFSYIIKYKLRGDIKVFIDAKPIFDILVVKKECA